MMVLAWLLYGLPKKAQQDERVKDGCSKTWWIFLCSTYGFVYFSTDQYAPSLPQMGVDLSGSQWLMSATVQFNCITKALMGLVIAGISDHVGRRPVMVGCLSLLAMASFCCGCAPNAGLVSGFALSTGSRRVSGACGLRDLSGLLRKTRGSHDGHHRSTTCW